MPVDWKSRESFTRLLAAIMAAHDLKLDYRRIATFFGQGATYDSIEGRFRVVRKEAEALRKEIAAAGITTTPRGRPKPSGPASTAPTRGHRNGTTNSSHKRSSSAAPRRVDHGRIVKTPTRKPSRRPGPGTTVASAIALDAEDDDASDTMLGARIKTEEDEDADGESDAPAYSFEDDGYATGNGVMDGTFGWHGFDNDDFPEAV